MTEFLRANARWLAGGLVCTLFSSFGQTFFIALSSGHVRAELSLTHGQFGTLYMLAALAAAALIPVFGRLIDGVRIERYALYVIAALAVSMVAMGLANGIVALFAAIVGLRVFGQGLLTHTAMTGIGRWFGASRGRAVSIAALGHQIGESLMPISFVAAAALIGWRAGWLAGAALLVVAVAPVIHKLFAVPRSPQAGGGEGPVAGRQWTRGEVVRDPLFWALMCGMLAPMAVGTMLFFHQVYYTELRGWPLAWFAGATPVLSAFAIAATLAAGAAADRFHVAVLIPVMLLFLAVATLVMAWVASPWAIVVFMAFIGTSFGIYAVVYGALLPQIYGTAHLGAIRSVSTGLAVLSSAAGPGLSGWLIDAGVGYLRLVGAVGVAVMALSAVMVAVSAAAGRRVDTGGR